MGWLWRKRKCGGRTRGEEKQDFFFFTGNVPCKLWFFGPFFVKHPQDPTNLPPANTRQHHLRETHWHSGHSEKFTHTESRQLQTVTDLHRWKFQTHCRERTVDLYANLSNQFLLHRYGQTAVHCSYTNANQHQFISHLSKVSCYFYFLSPGPDS